MNSAPNVTLTVFLQLILCYTAVSLFQVELSPKKPLFRMGGRHELTCRVSECSGNMTFSWSCLQDTPLYAEIKKSSNESTLIFKNVDANIETCAIQCRATCQGKPRQQAAKVQVYSFPKNPVISGHDSLLLGKENTLTCEVSDVYPAHQMTVEWLMGDKVVHTQEGEYNLKNYLKSYYTFIPQTSDKEKPVTCRVTLKLDGLPLEEQTREATVSMTVVCPSVNTVISVFPNNPKEKKILKIFCESHSNLINIMVLSKVLDGKETELVSGVGPQVSVLYHEANFSHSGVYMCKTTHACGEQMANVTVTVGTHPLVVSLQPDMSFITAQRGSSMTLSCNSSGCPYAHITWKNVTHQSLRSWNDAQAFVSQIGPWTVGVEDNRTFICEVECGSVVKSKLTELKVFSFPSDPTINSSGPFLENKETNLTCTVRDIFPADSFHMQWLDGELELHSVRGNFSDKLQNLSMTIPFRPKDSDQNKMLTCKVSLEMEGKSSQKTASTTLAVHYAPKHTKIDIRPQKIVKEGEAVTISCQTDSTPEGHLTLKRVQNGEETTLVTNNGIKISFTISFTNVSHSGIYVCEAGNKYGHQMENVQITVQEYVSCNALDEYKCNGYKKVFQAASIQSRSNNQVTVSAPPRNITVNVYPSKEVQEGETVRIFCQLVSFPPPVITLRKLENGNYINSSDGTFLLANLTSKDSGMYQVIATNALGSETDIFEITVMSKIRSNIISRLISTEFLIPAIALGILASVLSSLDCIRRAKRKGFYALTNTVSETV